MTNSDVSTVATIDAMKASGADWVLANINVVGYYRVNYDQGNWERLLNILSTSHQVRHSCLTHGDITYTFLGNLD